jgi:hypothetical protein
MMYIGTNKFTERTDIFRSSFHYFQMQFNSVIIRTAAASLFALLTAASLYGQNIDSYPAPAQLSGHRFLTLNAEICVNQIEATRTLDVGVRVRRGEIENEKMYFAVTPERVEAFRTAIDEGFPNGRITWGISWKALHDTTPDFVKIRELLVAYHHRYGDDITLMPHSWFANVYNSVEQLVSNAKVCF